MARPKIRANFIKEEKAKKAEKVDLKDFLFAVFCMVTSIGFILFAAWR